MEAHKKAGKPSSDVKSGVIREEIVKNLGGEPPKKSVEEIDRVHNPKNRKRAPGSVRV
jgi:hypothetical protein